MRLSTASIDTFAGMQPWQATFDFFDVDRSGALSLEDLRSCLQSLGQKVTIDQVKELLSDAGLPNERDVEFHEFVELMESEKSRHISSGALKRYFDTLDRDHNGFVTTAELRHAYTALGHGLTDRQMDIIMDRYDLDGNGQLGFDEFVEFVQGTGIVVDLAAPEPPPLKLRRSQLAGADAAAAKTSAPMSKLWGALTSPRTPDKGVPDKGSTTVEIKDKKLAEVLRPLAGADGKVNLTDLEKAVDLWTKHRDVHVDPESNPNLHWEKGRVKHGLASVIHKMNHIAIVVSDVGRSAQFYSDVLGLQQIRRPDFDRHGAWFTTGNIELHLIKGDPVVHSGSDLIVGHIAIETTDIDKVPEILEKAGVPFRQNVSVPKGKQKEGLGTNDSAESARIIKQYFVRDPDGYWFEICDCAKLTQYVLGQLDDVNYDQGSGMDLAETAMFVNLAERLAHRAARMQKELAKLSSELSMRPVQEIAQRLGCKQRAAQVDEEKLKKLYVRRGIYTDICQNETEESIREIMELSDNHVPTAMKIMQIRGWQGAVFQPPAFFDAGTGKVKPEAFLMPRYSITRV